MYQYDDSSASSTLPTPAAAGTAGFFTDGDPSAGQAATILRSDFMNMLMLELLNVVTAAGLTPSKTTYNQVLTAIQQLSVSAVEQALAYKVPVVAATAGSNITLSGLQTIDGVALTAGQRVLVKDQTNQTQNGIYVVAAGAWSLASDDNSAAEMIPGMLVPVQLGTINAVTVWQLKANAPIVIGTSILVFVEVAASVAQFALLSAANVFTQPQTVGSATAAGHAAQMGQIQTQAGTAFTTGGTAPAYTLAPTPAITAYANNQRFNVTFASAGTTGSNSINVNGLGAVPLRQFAADGTLVSAIITAGMNSDVQIVGAGTYALLLDSLPAPSDPTGAVLPFAGINVPSGYLLCNGALISRTTYANLFAALTIQTTGSTTSGSTSVTAVASTTNLAVGMPISGSGIQSGTTISAIGTGTITLSAAATATATGVTLVTAPYGVGDGSTTFALPDGRGVALRGLDNGRGLDSSRVLGTYQADSYASHTHGVTDPGHNHSVPMDNGTAGGTGWQIAGQSGANQGAIATGSSATGISIQASGGTETRMKNLAVNFIIKY